MITIHSNTGSVIQSIIARVQKLRDTDQMLRSIANNMLPVVHDRIHQRGEAADGNQIGTYSSSYLKLRNQGYKSDTVTRGTKKGSARTIKNYNRSPDPKVIISLTRQMENDFSVIATEKGYGLGYKNPENAKKVDYVEETYNKKIFALTEQEHQLALASAIEYKDSALHG